MTIIERDGTPYLVVLNDGKEPPPYLALVRVTVSFEPIPDVMKLDYTLRSPENDTICLRFLDFIIQSPLYANQELWQPGAGQPFFKKVAEQPRNGGDTGEINQYAGFAVRATVTPTGGLGLCVDVTSKAISRTPLPAHLTHDEFARWKDKHVIYRYGHSWYDIQLVGLSDSSATEYLITRDRKTLSLLEFAVQECQKPIPSELAQVPHDAAVVMYTNNRGEARGALAPLCYPVYGTDDGSAGSQHRYTIMPPHQRRKAIRAFVQQYLQRIRFGNTILQIANTSVSVSHQMFTVPDLRFGNGIVLSVRGTSGPALRPVFAALPARQARYSAGPRPDRPAVDFGQT